MTYWSHDLCQCLLKALSAAEGTRCAEEMPSLTGGFRMSACRKLQFVFRTTFTRFHFVLKKKTSMLHIEERTGSRATVLVLVLTSVKHYRTQGTHGAGSFRVINTPEGYKYSITGRDLLHTPCTITLNSFPSGTSILQARVHFFIIIFAVKYHKGG